MTGADFIRANTAVMPLPLVPEIRLHLASEITPLWQATERHLAESGVDPPYWAFAWVGGQALARFVLDRPDWVAGRRVLDFAAGNGVAAIAAARAGAARVVAADIDPLARAAQAMNAALNGVAFETVGDDLIGRPLPDTDLVLAGDICYERPLAERVEGWLRQLAGAGITVLLGDPGRTYLPRGGLEALARYTVPTTRELEDRTARETTVWRVLPEGG